MAHRPLTTAEIAVLHSNGCSAEDWTAVTVAPDFDPRRIHHAHCSGTVRFGAYTRLLHHDGRTLPSVIAHVTLHNVRIGDHCRIRHAAIADVDIADDVLIDQAGRIARTGSGPFAIGCPAHVLTEDGARAVPLWHRLTAQTAHLLCHYTGHPLAAALEAMIEQDAEALRGSRSVIGPGCRITRTGCLDNVHIGPGARIDGTARLDNCYIASTEDAPVHIGDLVQAADCVFLPASTVTGGTQVERCLVGEGVSLSGAFSGTHSLFFANSAFALGEADAVMAGPFATSHHKATLVLTCQTSFSTFGSGSNASNHHFKLGPRHGGVLRRGVKCGSGSYLLWPCDIGAFTTVVGRHGKHMDTAKFPFSLLLADGDKSVLLPGATLFSAGLYRDEQKWRERDARHGVHAPADRVNPAVLSPYVFQAMDAGCDLLRRCVGNDGDVRYGGVIIPADRVEQALFAYDTALVYYLGDQLIARPALADGAPPSLDELVERVRANTAADGTESMGTWRDWGGLLLPGGCAAGVVDAVVSGTIAGADALQARLGEVHDRYDDYVREWVARRWVDLYGPPSPESMARFIAAWRRAVLFRHSCFTKDAAKEFTPAMRIGYGVEEDAAVAFRRVRGDCPHHPLVEAAEREKNRLLEWADRLAAR